VIPIFFIPKKLLFGPLGCTSVALYRSLARSAISNLALTWVQSEMDEAINSRSVSDPLYEVCLTILVTTTAQSKVMAVRLRECTCFIKRRCILAPLNSLEIKEDTLSTTIIFGLIP